MDRRNAGSGGLLLADALLYTGAGWGKGRHGTGGIEAGRREACVSGGFQVHVTLGPAQTFANTFKLQVLSDSPMINELEYIP